MLNFPESTKVHKRIPKEAFYRHLPLSAALKEKIVSDVETIIVENSLKKENLNLADDSDVREILLLSIRPGKIFISWYFCLFTKINASWLFIIVRCIVQIG